MLMTGYSFCKSICHAVRMFLKVKTIAIFSLEEMRRYSYSEDIFRSIYFLKIFFPNASVEKEIKLTVFKYMHF